MLRGRSWGPATATRLALGSPFSHGDRVTEVSASRKRVLVVDDDPMMGTTLRLTLEDDYDVEIASSAEIAMRLLEKETYDLILCDLMMPRVSGIDLHRWLIARDANAGERMLFMTGGAYTDEAARFLRDEAKHHVEKPFRVEQLLARIESILRAAA